MYIYLSALDPCGVDTRVRPSGYNHFHGVDSILYSAVPNSSGGIVVAEEGCSSGGASKSKAEQDENLERFMAQNQPGPSLKLAASALAEMLAAGSNGASSATSRSTLSQVEATSETAVTTLDGASQLGNSRSGGGGQTRPQRMMEDCCSPSGSAGVHEGRDAASSLVREFGRLTAEEESYIASLASDSPTRCKPEASELPEDAFCDFGGPGAWGRAKAASGKMPEDAICDFGGGVGAWALSKAASGRMEYSANLRPVSWVDTVPQSAKGGALNSSGQRRVFSKGSAGIMRQQQQPSAITGPAKFNHEADAAEGNSNLMEAYNLLFSRGPDFASRPQSRSIMRTVSSPRVEVRPSDNAFANGAPFASTVTAASGLSLFGPHQELPSGGPSSQLPLDSSHNDQWHVNSTSCGSSPPPTQAHLDQQRSLSGSLPPTMAAAASRVFPHLKRGCPESSGSQTEVAYLGTGFHSLAASISNLSKVLFSLDSSALTPPDSAVLEDSLQSSILRLSECLLLEQSRMNKTPATRFVGSDESSASRHGRADGSLRDIGLGRHAETGGSANFGHLKVYDRFPSLLSNHRLGNASGLFVIELYSVGEMGGQKNYRKFVGSPSSSILFYSSILSCATPLQNSFLALKYRMIMNVFGVNSLLALP